MGKKRGKSMFEEKDVKESAANGSKKLKEKPDHTESEMDANTEIVDKNKENVDSATTTDVEVSNDDCMDDSLMDAQQDDDSSDDDEDEGAANTSEVSDLEGLSLGQIAREEDEDRLRGDGEPSDLVSYTLLSNNRALVQLVCDKEIYFKGSMQIMVLKGCVSCQGYKINPGDKFVNVYSPRGHSLLSLRASLESSTDDNRLQNFIENEKLQDVEIVADRVTILARKLSEPWMEYMNKNLKKAEKLCLFGQDNIRGTDSLTELEKCLNMTVFRPHKISTKLWKKGEDWDVALTSVEITKKNDQQPRVVATGGKGTGKSSFLRWLTNELLNTSPEILFLDLDPGQREFGLPGYISLSLIFKPVLGPNFCQPEPKWEKSVYFGDINVGNNPRRYIECVSLLVKSLPEASKTPLLVNTMGWCQGLGLSLNTEIIRKVKPTVVVRLNSRFKKKNYAHSLSCEYLMSKPSSWTHKTPKLSYSLLEFNAVPERKDAIAMTSKHSWGIPQANILRDIQTLAWMGRRAQFKDLPVYSVPYASVALHVVHEKVPDRGLLAALAYRIVDLCSVPENKILPAKDRESYSILESSSVTLSSGLGLVRGVDTDSKLIFLATDCPEEKLKQVNCLVGGHLSIPDQIQKLQKSGAYLAPLDKHDPLQLPWQKNQKLGKFAAMAN